MPTRSEGVRPSAAATSFVGRSRQLDEVATLVTENRVTTVTGPGGVGKTRLALEFAARAGERFSGIFLVDLAPVRKPAEVVAAVARTVGVTDQSNRSPSEKIVTVLEDRTALLILDNCEHVLGSVADLVAELLDRLPELRFLITSRTALAITEEYRYPVPRLTVPPVTTAATMEQLQAYESVQLLVDRARAAVPGFAPTDADAGDIARLCLLLEGIPLAIELAVARLRTMSLAQIVERLPGSLGLLSLGSRTAETRQQTLRSLIDWSFDLCTPLERRLWARLSVFEGGFDLAAAEGICTAVPDADPDCVISRDQVLDLLGALVDQSIVFTDRVAGDLRFRMLDTIKTYGAERLEQEGLALHYRRSHREYFLTVARRSALDWGGPDQTSAMRRLDPELGNLQAVMDTSAADGAAETAVELVAALRYRWYADGYHAQGRRWASEALAGSTEITAARATALWVTAWVCLLQGDRETAESLLDECEAVCDRLDLPVDRAYVHKLRGLDAFFSGDLPGATRHFEAAVPRLRALGETPGFLFATFEYSLVLNFTGRVDEAHRLTGEALAESVACGDVWARSHLLFSRGIGCWLQGESESAAECAEEALRLHGDLHTSVGTAWMNELLAWTALAAGDSVRAEVLSGRSDAQWRRIGTDQRAFGPYLARLHDDFAARLRTPAPEPVRRRSGPLTERQLQMAERVSRGARHVQSADRRGTRSVRTHRRQSRRTHPHPAGSAHSDADRHLLRREPHLTVTHLTAPHRRDRRRQARVASEPVVGHEVGRRPEGERAPRRR